MTKTFYCDKETYTLIEDARKINPEFNLSNFIKKCLKEVSGESKKMDIEFIEMNLNKYKLDKDKVQQDIDYWESQKIKYYQDKEFNELRNKEQDEQLTLTHQIDNFLAKKTKEQEEEYRKGLGVYWKSYYQYAIFKLKEVSGESKEMDNKL